MTDVIRPSPLHTPLRRKQNLDCLKPNEKKVQPERRKRNRMHQRFFFCSAGGEKSRNPPHVFLSWVQGVVAKLVCCLLHEQKFDSLRCAMSVRTYPDHPRLTPLAERRKESKEKREAKIAVIVTSSSSENIGYPLSPVHASSLDLSGIDQAGKQMF
ncbi:hypothetical protein LX32DRAFT_289638 [Colletotrichum zoysiae]|uniref:Uncharacterized protein n=1 Tax=Colletotrichum zoysiae TaxID=1216348 RepID=A0AAD9H278_9PEZI|nr:hypothetical protein LX32DRAFT_289638 [Colletotrichum zoysiae]